MEPVTALYRLGSAQQEMARVLRFEEEWVVLVAARGEVRATLAASCLIKPQPNDLVLLARSEHARCYVVAVLERASPGKTELEVRGDLEIGTRDGALTLRGERAVNVLSNGAIGIVGESLRCIGRTASVVARSLSFGSDQLNIDAKQVSWVSTVVDRVVERVSERVQRSYRHVEEFESVRAKHMTLRADQVLDLRAGHALVTAETLVKIDAEQVHLG